MLSGSVDITVSFRVVEGLALRNHGNRCGQQAHERVPIPAPSRVCLGTDEKSAAVPPLLIPGAGVFYFTKKTQLWIRTQGS